MMAPVIEARFDGDWLICGVPGCNQRFALGLAPVRLDARTKCPRCKTWQGVPLSAAGSAPEAT